MEAEETVLGVVEEAAEEKSKVMEIKVKTMLI